MNDAGLIQSMLKKQSIDAGIDQFLIEKVVGCLCVKRDRALGYTRVAQK